MKFVRQSRPLEAQEGFVLVLALLLLAVAAGGGLAVLVAVRTSVVDVAQVVEEARARSVAQAAIVRIAGGLVAVTDPIRDAGAMRTEPYRWRFDGMDVDLIVEAESDKVDVNAGHFDLLSAALDGAGFDETLKANVLETIRHSRSRNTAIPSVAALLEPCRRLGAGASRMEGVLTILTRAPGVQLRRSGNFGLDLVPSVTQSDRDVIERAMKDGRSPLDDRRLVHLRPYLSEGSSYYRFAARVKRSDGTLMIERRADVQLIVARPHIRVIGATWRKGHDADLCEQ